MNKLKYNNQNIYSVHQILKMIKTTNFLSKKAGRQETIKLLLIFDGLYCNIDEYMGRLSQKDRINFLITAEVNIETEFILFDNELIPLVLICDIDRDEQGA